MKKAEVVELLQGMAGAMRRTGDPMRARAYTRAARAVAAEKDFDVLYAKKRLRDIPGVGPKIEAKIVAFVEKGEKPDWLDKAPRGVPRVDRQVATTTVPKTFFTAPFQGAPDLHCHTTWSDGTLSLEDVVLFAEKLKAAAIGVSDHSGSLHVANGLRPADVLAQWQDIERVQAEHPDIVILRGTECDILRDGSLDHPEHILTGFDYVIGSLHSHLKLPQAQQTERVLAALDNAYLTVLGHPTTAVPGRRPPANLDLDAVFEKAAKRGVAMEVNGNPGRLDLPVKLARQALRAGCKLALSSDGHSAWEMMSLAKARRMAKAAGATDDDIVNHAILERARPKKAPKRAR